jgi:hypothetical protein
LEKGSSLPNQAAREILLKAVDTLFKMIFKN